MPQQNHFCYINLIMSEQLTAASLVQSTQMLHLSVCGSFSIAGHQGLQAHSQVAVVIVLCVSCLTTKWSMLKSAGSGPERLLFERSSNLRSCTRLREAGNVPVSLLLLKSTSCIMDISEWCWQELEPRQRQRLMHLTLHKVKCLMQFISQTATGASTAINSGRPIRPVSYVCSEQSGTDRQLLCSLPASEYAITQLELTRSTDLMLSSASSSR